jgi:hypothetical protein
MMSALDIRALALAKDRIEEAAAERGQSMIQNKAPNYETYAERFGRYHGLVEAVRIIEEVAKEIQ